MDPETRQSLLLRAGEGNDPGAWAEFCRLYQPLVRTYIARFQVHDHDADDLAQEVFIKLHRQLSKFSLDHSRGQFRAWLRSLTDNAVRDWLRSDNRRRQVMAGMDPHDLESQFAQTHTDDQRRQEQWRKAVFELAMQRIREEFKDRSRLLACFEQTTLRGRPAREVAAELGIDSVNTVYVYSHRVLQRLRELAAEYDEEISQPPA